MRPDQKPLRTSSSSSLGSSSSSLIPPSADPRRTLWRPQSAASGVSGCSNIERDARLECSGVWWREEPWASKVGLPLLPNANAMALIKPHLIASRRWLLRAAVSRARICASPTRGASRQPLRCASSSAAQPDAVLAAGDELQLTCTGVSSSGEVRGGAGLQAGRGGAGTSSRPACTNPSSERQRSPALPLLQGVCRTPSGMVVFVERALPGEVCEARVVQSKKSEPVPWAALEAQAVVHGIAVQVPGHAPACCVREASTSRAAGAPPSVCAVQTQAEPAGSNAPRAVRMQAMQKPSSCARCHPTPTRQSRPAATLGPAAAAACRACSTPRSCGTSRRM